MQSSRTVKVATTAFARLSTSCSHRAPIWEDRSRPASDVVESLLGPSPASARDFGGLWWDSTRRVPDARLLLRRNFDLSSIITPWTVARNADLLGLREPARAARSVLRRTPTDREPRGLASGIRLDRRVDP